MNDSIFKTKSKVIIGMIHVKALPGTPGYNGKLEPILDQAMGEASIYRDYSVDAILIENMHDRPYQKRLVGPEITAALSVICHEVKKLSELPCGLQILAGANKQALAVALAAKLDFIRAEGFVFGHLADEGYIESDAAELLRYRKQIGAENIDVYTDIKKKHSSHSITDDVDLLETAEAAGLFLSDGLIITGRATSKEADTNDLKQVRQRTKLPVLVGSGITRENLDTYWPLADGFIVGSWLKDKGYWENALSAERVKSLMEKAVSLRSFK